MSWKLYPINRSQLKQLGHSLIFCIVNKTCLGSQTEYFCVVSHSTKRLFKNQTFLGKFKMRTHARRMRWSWKVETDWWWRWSGVALTPPPPPLPPPSGRTPGAEAEIGRQRAHLTPAAPGATTLSITPSDPTISSVTPTAWRGVSPTNQPPGLGWGRRGWGGSYSPSASGSSSRT